MPSTKDKHEPPGRGRHRHGYRDLARRRQGRKLGEADRRQVRHQDHQPFPDRRAEDPIAGTVDFLAGRALFRGRRCPNGWPSSRPRKQSAKPASASAAISRVRCSSPCRRSRSNGRSALRSPAAARGNAAVNYDRPVARSRRRQILRSPRALPIRLGRQQHRRQVRHQGFADLAVDRLRVWRDRDPARRRSDPARRNRHSALHRHRRIRQSGIADPVLAAVRALDCER